MNIINTTCTIKRKRRGMQTYPDGERNSEFQIYCTSVHIIVLINFNSTLIIEIEVETPPKAKNGFEELNNSYY